MVDKIIEIIVKVGRMSSIIFNENVKAHRAITANDLNSKIYNNERIKIIVIEHVDDRDISRIKEILDKCTLDGRIKKVNVLIKYSEAMRSNILSEYETYEDIDELHNKIENNTGVNVSHKINWIHTDSDNSIDKSDEIIEVNLEKTSSLVDTRDATVELTETVDIGIETDDEAHKVHKVELEKVVNSKRDTNITECNKYKDTINELEYDIKELEDKLNKLDSKRDNELKNKLKLMTALERAVKDILELKEQLGEYVEVIRELNINIDELKNEVSSTDLKISEIERKHNEELNKLNIERIELQSKVNIIQSQLQAKEYQYNTLVQTIGMDEDGAVTLLENKKIIEGLNESLRKQVIELKEEVEKSEKERLLAVRGMKQVNEMNKQLKESLTVMTAGVAMGSGLNLPPCRYEGRGNIISVSGCGSFGITTTAMSLALRFAMDYRVIFIDFDTVMPKADIWFRTPPIIKGIQDVDPSDSRSTGLGLLLDRQIGFFIENRNSIIKKVLQNKAGSLDYISGIYRRLDTLKLISTDFTSFFNFCGNSYDYVIVDLGRLGCSEIVDNMIKIISDIAYRNVVVTTNDRLEIRTFSMKLSEAKINRSNLAWMLNMCENTSMDKQTKAFMGTNRYGFIPFSDQIYGRRVDFSKVRMTRDKFNLFVKESIHK